MSQFIYLVQPDGSHVPMSEQRYSYEDVLQKDLEDDADLLAGDQIRPDNPLRWLLVLREAGVPDRQGGPDRWSLDHLFLDQDGVPTLVEVKRADNTEIRRTVVGQMLDYATNALLYWPVSTIRERLDERCAKKGLDPARVIADFIGPAVDPAAFWSRVEENLAARRVRLLFVADEIPAELVRIIEFLGSLSDRVEVLGVEVRQFVEGGEPDPGQPPLRTLVPRVVGRPARDVSAASPGSRGPLAPDESSFLALLRTTTNGERAEAVARSLLTWARGHEDLRVWYGAGPKQAALYVGHPDALGKNRPFFACLAPGTVLIQFDTLKHLPPFDSPERRLQLLARINSIDGVKRPDRMADSWPGIKYEVLGTEAALQQFREAFDWVVSLVRGG